MTRFFLWMDGGAVILGAGFYDIFSLRLIFSGRILVSGPGY